MNNTLQKYAREKLIEDLVKLPEGWQNKFKLIYGRTSQEQTAAEILAQSIEEVVNGMSEKNLDWAMQQVENSLKKQQPDNT